MKNQFCLGTKLLHFYNPEQNPILDNTVKDNLTIKGENGDLLTKTLCIEFREAAKCFCAKHNDYFDKFYKSDIIAHELRRRCMTKDFSTMGILDMALYLMKETEIQ
jgi:hypothetical protein